MSQHNLWVGGQAALRNQRPQYFYRYILIPVVPGLTCGGLEANVAVETCLQVVLEGPISAPNLAAFPTQDITIETNPLLRYVPSHSKRCRSM